LALRSVIDRMLARVHETLEAPLPPLQNPTQAILLS